MLLQNSNKLVDNLYYLLWLKDTGLKDDCLQVKIPETVIFQNSQIYNWFFYSQQGEAIQMKKESNLKNNKILD